MIIASRKKYGIIKKISISIISIFILSVMVFYMARLAPGDPLVSYYGDRVERMSTEEREKAVERLGLDKPIYVQYGKWLKDVLNGDFGLSFKYKQDVLTIIESRMENTVLLAGVGFVIIFTLALIIAYVCAYNKGKLLDKLICNIGNITSFIPEFWFSLILILIFSVNLRLLPSSGAYTIGKEGDVVDRINHLILPIAVIVISHLWYYTYILRDKIIQELSKDYVILAKAKGISKWKILFIHCLKNIMPTYISTMAIALPHIIAGTYIVETVFSYPGIGSLAFESAKYHDYNMLMIICLITGIITVLSNVLSQILNAKINPMMKS